jgi:FkbM family methyltransferase
MLMKLPNGLQVDVIEPFEAQVLYHEIFEMAVYNAHGISIHEGATVVDVGANIGLFSILMLQSAPRIRLFAVEPIPVLHNLLRDNLQRYASESQVTILPIGVAAHGGEAEFIYTPHSTMTSSMASVETKSDARMGDIVLAGLTDLAQVFPARRPLYEQFQRLMPVPIVGNIIMFGLLAAFAIPALRNRLLTRRARCPLLTLSQIIEQNELATIDLLKIDVEGSEAEVIAGIADGDWKKIRQFVIEVHDIDGRVSRMRALLEERGYQTFVEQAAWELHHLFHFYTLFAIQKCNPEIMPQFEIQHDAT